MQGIANTTELPTKFTLGTKYYCIGFVNQTNCFHLQPDIISTLSNLLNIKINNFQSIQQILKYIPLGTIQGLSITGIILICFALIIFILSFYFISRVLKIILTLLCFVCFGIFIFPVIILYTLTSKANIISPFIEGKVGTAGPLLLWTSIGSGFMAFCMLFILYIK